MNIAPTFKQSRTWWKVIPPINELIKSSDLVFNHAGRNGNRPALLLKQPIDGCNCIELDIDRWGLTIKSMYNYGKHTYETTTHSSKNIYETLVEYCKKHSSQNLVNPRFLKIKALWENFMATRFVYNVQYFLRAKMVLYSGKQSWQKIWFQILQGGLKPFFFSCTGNPFKTKYWHWHIGVFPIYFTKHNGSWSAGLNFLFFRLQIQHQF